MSGSEISFASIDESRIRGVEISETLEIKVAALLCHESQLGADADLAADVVRRRAASAGSAGGVAFAESYRVLRLA